MGLLQMAQNLEIAYPLSKAECSSGLLWHLSYINTLTIGFSYETVTLQFKIQHIKTANKLAIKNFHKQNKDG